MRFALLLLVASLALGCSEETSTAGTGGSGGGGEGGAGAGPLDLDVGPEDRPCTPGQVELADGSCRDAGVAECPAGFEPDEGGCMPILPDAPCDPGTMALPGETTCRPVAPCGAGKYEGIPTDANTVYVDLTYTGPSDGSLAQPYKGLPGAIANSPPGSLIAVAPGTYGSFMEIDKPLSIWGKCPAEVRFSGGFWIRQGGDGAELHRLQADPGNIGILVENANDVLVDEVWVHDTGYMGIYVGAPNASIGASLTVSRSLVEHTFVNGIFSYGQHLEVRDSVVRNIQASSNDEGHGINNFWEPPVGNDGGTSIIERTLVQGAYRDGIRMRGGDLTVVDSAILDVEPEPSTGEWGRGIVAWDVDDQPASIELRGVTVARVHLGGVVSNGAAIDAERLTVRDVEKAPAQDGASGVIVFGDGEPTPARLHQISVARATLVGVGLLGAEGDLEGLLVRDVTGQEGLAVTGFGVTLESNLDGTASSSTVHGVHVERARVAGFSVATPAVVVESLFVDGVTSDDAGNLGRGVSVQPMTLAGPFPADLTLSHCAIVDVQEVGIALLGGSNSVHSCSIRGVARATAAPAGFAVGVLAQPPIETLEPASAALSRLAIDEVDYAGIVALGADITLDASEVLAGATTLDGFGTVATSLRITSEDGELTLFPSTLNITGSRIADNPHAGVALFSSQGSLADSEILCNAVGLNGEEVDGLDFSLEDAGGNWCGCDGVEEVCKVLSSSLQPPTGFATGAKD